MLGLLQQSSRWGLVPVVLGAPSQCEWSSWRGDLRWGQGAHATGHRCPLGPGGALDHPSVGSLVPESQAGLCCLFGHRKDQGAPAG